MHAWAQVEIPPLVTPLRTPRIHDSASESFVDLPGNRDVSLYVCGITPYDATHIGHAATYLAFDTLIRVWRMNGATVNYAQNVTDVDDPLLERAVQIGRPWQEIAVEQTALFRSDMEALRVIPPNHFIGAVESIPLVIQRIHQLEQANATYSLDGDVYYDISNTHILGSISHLNDAQMQSIFAQRGGDPDRHGKRHPLDALLWRKEQPNDPSWDSDFGRGRPGWHIECAAIALEYLGDTIDVQGGGSDLKFPHHEMSAAHAQSATGVAPFARTFMHTGMVALDGEKMSKSRGNLVFVSHLREQGIDPMAIRLTILHHHYRQDWSWEHSDLVAAQAELARWRQAFSQPAGAVAIEDDVLNVLADDLDTPSAISAINDWVNQTLSGNRSSAQAPQVMKNIADALLGIV